MEVVSSTIAAMSRVLRSGTRRNYKKLDDGEVEVLEELFTERETEEESDAATESQKESDDAGGIASDEAADNAQVILPEVSISKKVQKKDKLRRLQNEIKEVEARIKEHRKRQPKNTKSMKDVENEVNSLLDQQE